MSHQQHSGMPVWTTIEACWLGRQLRAMFGKAWSLKCQSNVCSGCFSITVILQQVHLLSAWLPASTSKPKLVTASYDYDYINLCHTFRGLSVYTPSVIRTGLLDLSSPGMRAFANIMSARTVWFGGERSDNSWENQGMTGNGWKFEAWEAAKYHGNLAKT